MATTLFDLTLALADVLGDRKLATTTSLAGDTTSIVSTDLDEAPEYWQGGTVWITTGAQAGKMRRITLHDKNALTFTPAVGAAVASGVSFYVAGPTYPLQVLIQAINAALTDSMSVGKLPYRYKDAGFVTVGGQEQYELPTPVGEQPISDVRTVMVLENDTDPYEPTDYRHWIETADGYIRFDGGYEPDVSGKLIELLYAREHPLLFAETDTMHFALGLKRVKWAAAAWIHRNTFIPSGKDKKQTFDLFTEAINRAAEAANENPIDLPETPSRFFPSGW